MVKVAGIDQSKFGFGWALGSDHPDTTPQWGCDDLSQAGTNEGLMYHLAAKRVRWLIEHGAQKVFFEKPIKMRHDNIHDDLCKFGLVATILHVCYEHKVSAAWVDQKQWRPRFLGISKPPPGLTEQAVRRKWYKEAAMQQCLARNWLVDNDNAAEALGILDFGLASVSGPYKRRVGPIVRRADLKRMLL